jgi:hypothetical protein
MRKMCTLITSKGTDIDENIANLNHATRTHTPKPGYLNLSIVLIQGDKMYLRALNNGLLIVLDPSVEFLSITKDILR